MCCCFCALLPLAAKEERDRPGAVWQALWRAVFKRAEGCGWVACALCGIAANREHCALKSAIWSCLLCLIAVSVFNEHFNLLGRLHCLWSDKKCHFSRSVLSWDKIEVHFMLTSESKFHVMDPGRQQSTTLLSIAHRHYKKTASKLAWAHAQAACLVAQSAAQAWQRPQVS